MDHNINAAKLFTPWVGKGEANRREKQKSQHQLYIQGTDRWAFNPHFIFLLFKEARQGKSHFQECFKALFLGVN